MAERGFVNAIEMIELGDGESGPLIWTMPGVVADNAEDILVGRAVPEGGVVFNLSTTEQATGTYHFLDSTPVGAYLPDATITVFTHDMTADVPRTRADRPYSVQVEVSGLYSEETLASLSISDAQLRNAASEVRLQLFGQDYPEGEHALADGVVSVEHYAEYALTSNGIHPTADTAGTLTFYSSLNPSSPESGHGEEHFVVSALSDGAVGESPLDSKHLEVFPVWSSDVSGLDNPVFVPYQHSGVLSDEPGDLGSFIETISPDLSFQQLENETAYERNPPPVTFAWENLYPGSFTGVLITPAGVTSPWGGRWVTGSTRTHDVDTVVDFSQTVSDWGNVFGGQGRYILWHVSYTEGIGWEVGGQVDEAGVLVPGGLRVAIAPESIEIRASINSLSE